MATKFIEPGGDADFAVTNFYLQVTGATAVATDFVHGGHIKSIKFRPGNADVVGTPVGVLVAAGGRISTYLYFNALPSSTATLYFLRNGGGTAVASLRMTSAGTLELWNGTSTAQIGIDGSTLSTGTWYRICLSYTITSTTVNRFELFKDGVSDISVTNATIAAATVDHIRFGNFNTNSTLDFRLSDVYVDNSSALTDTGNVWVTAKRPFANGTTNGFSTQIGSGPASPYGTGHAQQENERPLSVANGWSDVNAGSTDTEEYNIEGAATGDIDISSATLISHSAWVFAKSALSETAQIVNNGVTSNIALTSTNTMFTKITDSASYVAGTGTDVGIVTSATVTTVSLFECGILFAYIPSAGGGGKSTKVSISVSTQLSIQSGTNMKMVTS